MRMTPEVSILCARTNMPCPFLMECAIGEQGAIDAIESAQTKYLDAAVTSAVYAAETSIVKEARMQYTQDPESDHVVIKFVDREQAQAGLEESLSNLIDSHERILDHYRLGAWVAELTCVGGPIVVKRRVLFGEKTVNCLSLIALLNREKSHSQNI